jgi:hypothetical protein
MNGCLPDEPTLRRFIAEIETAPPRPHHSALLANTARLVPDCEFRYALTRGGWYRPGGLIRPDGERIADDLERWAEEALAECGGDLMECIDRHAGEDLLATRHTGRTHYFVGAYGPGVADFMQLEVEELQEILDRRLVDPANPPADLSELTEPMSPLVVDAQPVGRPHYRFRRITDIRQVLSGQIGPAGEPAPMARFMDEWAHSRAGAKGHFSEHWIVALREHTDRYRNAVLSAAPVSRHARALKPFHWHPEARGLALGEQIRAYDRAAGYPVAWYFHMVAGGLAPHAIAYALKADLADGFRYLSDAETHLLDSWLERPYTV